LETAKITYDREATTGTDSTADEKRKTRSLALVLWDLGASREQTKNWPSFYAGTDAFVWVVDCSGGPKAVERSAALLDEQLPFLPRLIPVLVLANKQDATAPVSAKDVERIMALDVKFDDREYTVIPCSVFGAPREVPARAKALFRSRFDPPPVATDDNGAERKDAQDESEETTKEEERNEDEDVSRVTASSDDVDTKKTDDTTKDEETTGDDAKDVASVPSERNESTVRTEDPSVAAADAAYAKWKREREEEENRKRTTRWLTAGTTRVASTPWNVDAAMAWLGRTIHKMRYDPEIQAKLRFEESQIKEERTKSKSERDAKRKAAKKRKEREDHERHGMKRFVMTEDEDVKTNAEDATRSTEQKIPDRHETNDEIETTPRIEEEDDDEGGEDVYDMGV
tara:strand:+ start:450 stop:1646 length:1197 start_codon:yes stop_codon:yes gene_type:complete